MWSKILFYCLVFLFDLYFWTMQNQNYYVIGVMSGTSLDGVDLAYIHFNITNDIWAFNIIESETIGYSQIWLQQLRSAVEYSEEQLVDLDINYTKLLGEIISAFIKKYKIENLDAVSSHGHTILHQPNDGLTLQIGNLPAISQICNQTVVCDFRVQDVRLGGQGAPLVPIGDRILFSEYDFCLNLGGFSNISFEEKGQRIAFDISPVNTVLNYYANQLGLDYDDKGELAKTGKIDDKLLSELNKLDFYKKAYPKSLGFEFVKHTVLPLIDNYLIDVADKLRTFIEHIVIQTSLALKDKKGKLLITGGGAYNTFLIERLKSYMPDVEIVIPELKVLEFKEALIFALLGVLRLRHENNVLSSVTGARIDHSSGNIFYPK